MNATATGMALLALLGAFIPVVHLYRNRHKPGAIWLLALCCVLASYPMGSLLVGGEIGLRHRFSSIALVAPIYVLAVVSYLRLQPRGWSVLKGILFIYMPMALLAPWITGDWYLAFADPQPEAASGHLYYELGTGAWVMKILSYLCIILGAVMVLQQLSASRHSSTHLLSLALFPVLAGMLDLAAALADFTPYAGVTNVQIGTTVGLFALSYALLRQQMLSRVPVSRNKLMRHLREGVCVVSDDGVITDCNDALATILGVTTSKLINGKASRVLPESLLAVLDRQRREQAVLDAEVNIENTDRYVCVSAKALDEDAGCAAILLTVTDVTQRKMELASVTAEAGELKEVNEHLEHLSNTDELTGLGNRRCMHEALSLRSYEDQSASIGLIMVDIDHFKAINDTHGHSAGDAVLIRLAQAMRDTCRDNDLIVRWGGEEFVVLLNESDEQRLQLAAERLRLHIRRLVIELENGVALQVTASIGATLVRPGQSSESALRQVDRLLYEAKQEGRDRVKSSRKLDPDY